MLLANAITDLVAELTDWLEDVSAEWWFLVVILVVAFLDSVIPVVPSETAVIIGGVAAGAGDQNLWMVIGAGALGAFLGDNTAYLIGSRFAPWFERRAKTREKTAKRLVWAHDQIEKRGGMLLITARFIPGGRTVLTLSCGITEQRWRWFAPWVALAAIIWATYAAGLGYIFGQQFEDHHTMAFLLAFGAALFVTVSVEIGRHIRNKRRQESARTS
jgi:membrane protein DedA with SNARE-associated domain